MMKTKNQKAHPPARTTHSLTHHTPPFLPTKGTTNGLLSTCKILLGEDNAAMTTALVREVLEDRNEYKSKSCKACQQLGAHGYRFPGWFEY